MVVVVAVVMLEVKSMMVAVVMVVLRLVTMALGVVEVMATENLLILAS